MAMAMMSASTSWEVAAACCLLIISAMALGRRWWEAEGPRLAPGPPRWPVFGHLLGLGSAQMGLARLEQRYGSILTLWLGGIPSIAISGAAETRQALLECGAALASRPRFYSRAILTGDYCIMNTSLYGPYWRSLRRGLVSAVLGPSNLVRLSPIRRAIFDSFIASLRQQATAEGSDGIVSFSAPSRLAIFRILAFMCAGRHLDEDAIDTLDEIARHTLLLQGLLKGDFIPLLRLFDRKQLQIREEYRRKQERFWGPLIDENRALMASEDEGTRNSRAGCYMHTLLSMEFDVDELCGQSTKGSSDVADGRRRNHENREIAALCTEFMNAGTDTTAANVEWAMANLVYHPEIQQKVYEEIQALVGDRDLCEADIEHLPYLRAVIKETLRRHPSAHFTFLHSPTKGPCKVGGYDIPENAVVSFHLASILRDPTVWEDPMVFRPERFLDVEIDLTGWKKSNALPFGAGRRICPGAKLALLHGNLLVGRLVQRLQWFPAKEGDCMDFNERNAGVVAMKNPLFARIIPRPAALTQSS